MTVHTPRLGRIRSSSKRSSAHQAKVVKREFANLRLRSEEEVEFRYSPTWCKKTHRVVVLRKNLSVEKNLPFA